VEIILTFDIPIAYTLTASRHFHTQLPYLIPPIDNCVDDHELQYRVVTFESICSALDAVAYSHQCGWTVAGHTRQASPPGQVTVRNEPDNKHE